MTCTNSSDPRELGKAKLVAWLWRRLAAHLRDRWFELLFVALLPTAGLVVALATEWTLRDMKTARTTLFPSAEASAAAPAAGAGELARITRIDQTSPTEVRITGEGPQPPQLVFAAVRAPASDTRTIKQEAFYLGGGVWSATVRLSNTDCRENRRGVDQDHLTFRLSLLSTDPDRPKAIGGHEPVTSAPETEWRLSC